MNSSPQRLDIRPTTGYLSFLEGFRGLGLYLLLAAAFATSIVGFDPTDARSFLSFPLVLGLSIIIGLLFRYSGAFVSFMIILGLGAGLGYQNVGIFENMSLQQGAIFVLGQAITTGLFSTISAVAFGYNFQRSELATSRQNLLYKVFNALPIGIWVRARDGRSIFVNERWAEFSPYSAEEIVASGRTEPPVDLGRKWERFVDGMIDSEKAAIHYDNVELENTKGEHALMTLITLRMFIDQEDDFGSLSLLIDETALRTYEAKIRQSEQNLQLALHNAKMGFWTENIETRDIHCDDNWYKLLELDPDPNRPTVEIWNARLHPEDCDRVRQSYRDFYNSGARTARLDYRIRKGEADYIWVQDSILITQRSKPGTARCIMGTMQDISEQKKAELELTLAKEKAEAANRAKSQFLATISHEIRTPLNAIIGLSSFLAESELDDDQLDLVQTVHSSGGNLLLLLNEILDFSKIEAGRFQLEQQEFPLRLTIEDSVKLFKLEASEKNVCLDLDLDANLPEFAFGDMERLRQVLQNLLSNAVKFTDAGSVTVIARYVDASYLEREESPAAGLPHGSGPAPEKFLLVRVRDSGIGIAPENQHLLFQPFSQVDASTTRRYAGTGLGLVICKRLITGMGGRIWLDSQAGSGAEFVFVIPLKLASEQRELPLTLDSDDSQEDVSEPRFAVRNPLNILVVGPDDSTADLLQACRGLGYTPHHAAGYDLHDSAFGQRKYDLLLVVLDSQLQALELAREVSCDNYVMHPAAMIGFDLAEQGVSCERCRLSGLKQVEQNIPDQAQLAQLIKQVTDARG